jgi:hypothetical protein
VKILSQNALIFPAVGRGILNRRAADTGPPGDRHSGRRRKPLKSGRKPLGSCGDTRYYAFDPINPIANAQIEWAARVRHGAQMKTFARFLLVGTMLLVARCAWATEPSPVAFAKSVVSERGSQTFATVSYPDRCLIVEFRLEPYSAGKATAVRAFGEITKKIAQGAFSKFPKIKSVQLIGNLSLRDKRGHETVDRAVMVKFLKVNAATIKWEDVDPTKVVEIADKHWVLPELDADKK